MLQITMELPKEGAINSRQICLTLRSLPRLGGLLQLVDVNFEMPEWKESKYQRFYSGKMSIIYPQQTFQSKDPICFQVPTVQVSSSGRIIPLKGPVNNLPSFHRQHLDSEHCTDIVNRPACQTMMVHRDTSFSRVIYIFMINLTTFRPSFFILLLFCSSWGKMIYVFHELRSFQYEFQAEQKSSWIIRCRCTTRLKMETQALP